MTTAGAPRNADDVLRSRLLDLHRELVEVERLAYERVHGRLTPADLQKIEQDVQRLTEERFDGVVRDGAMAAGGGEGGTSQGSGKQDPGKTVIAEKALVGQHSGKQKGNVALKHYEEKDSVEPIAADNIVEKVETHD